MVLITLKKGDDAKLLFETPANTPVGELTELLRKIYNDILRIERLAMAIESLAEHGICKPPEMQGLTDEQITELKLEDPWSRTCYPSGGGRSNPDPIGRRTGNAPSEQLGSVLVRTAAEAKAMVGKDQVRAGVCMTAGLVAEALARCRGAVMIVYPMGLPPHEVVESILSDSEDLSGTQAANEVFDAGTARLWWAGRELLDEKLLSDYVGKNEKTKIVVKIQKRGIGAPAREPAVNEETQKAMMAYAYKKQEEWKKLEADAADSHLDAAWADPAALRRNLNGVGNIRLR